MVLIWLSSTSIGQPERCLSLNEKSPEQNLSKQFRHCLSFKASSSYTLRNFLAACACSFLYGNKKAKYDENARFYTPFER